MNKLIICHPKHGHMTIENPTDIDAEFEKIMREGYGDKIPATFYKPDGEGGYDQVDKADVKNLPNDVTVDEVLVVGPLQGG